ncbi:MAG: TlpA family protein disulfide reductase [Candidatus Binatia bacterium]
MLDFALSDQQGQVRTFPSGRPSLLCFVKEDCPTCAVAVPLIDGLARQLGDVADVWLIGQDADHNARLIARHQLTTPVLDDSALRVSYAYEIETVPTIVLADANGHPLQRAIGFVRAEWRGVADELARLTGTGAARLDWKQYPEWRAGCGSRSVEPGIAERLAAEASGSPLRARRLTIGDGDDPIEFCLERGFSDGLPVVPPTPERVLRMLGGTRRAADEVVAVVPPNLAPATVEKVAINAVMAGCKPEYLPVVVAAVEAICTEEFNIHGVLGTTFFSSPIIIVNGPVRERLDINCGLNALGQGARANATIGRAVQLVVRNVGGGRPGEIDRATLGQPGKFTFCFGELEERSHWEPLHVERGFAPGQSAVTVFAGGAPVPIVDQLARDARSLATSYGLALAGMNHPKLYTAAEVVVVIPPEHADTFAVDGWSKTQVREQIQRATLRPLRELVRGAGGCAEGLPVSLLERQGGDAELSKFKSPEQITLVVAGGPAGKFGAYLGGWLGGAGSSAMITRAIQN